MKLVYPAIFHNEEGSYWVEFPDLIGCQSFGNTIIETLLNAKEALEAFMLTLLENKEPLPIPTSIESIKVGDDCFVSLVDTDLSAYLRKGKAIKKTLTIPKWLNDAAIDKGINFSQTLQEALINRINN